MNDNIKKNIGLVLRDLRKSRLLTVDQVAEATKVSKDTIYRYEQGRAKEISTLGTLLSYYDVMYDIFFKLVYDKSHK